VSGQAAVSWSSQAWVRPAPVAMFGGVRRARFGRGWRYRGGWLPADFGGRMASGGPLEGSAVFHRAPASRRTASGGGAGLVQGGRLGRRRNGPGGLTTMGGVAQTAFGSWPTVVEGSGQVLRWDPTGGRWSHRKTFGGVQRSRAVAGWGRVGWRQSRRGQGDTCSAGATGVGASGCGA